MENRFGNSNYFGKHEPYGNRELKYYKDIYGNDVRLMTTKEKNIVNKILVISSVFIVILLSGLFYKAYLVQKEIDERTKVYLMSGDSIDEGRDIVADGGVIVSSDSDIVDVEADGTIVAKKSGTTSITIYKNIDKNNFDNGYGSLKDASDIYDAYNNVGVEGEFTFDVVVKQKVEGVLLGMSSISMNVGETNRIYANVLPHTAYDKDVTWSSSNNNVVTVDSKGVLSARSAGSAVITVKTKDGGFKDTVLVEVTKRKSENNIYINVENNNLYVGDKSNLIVVVSPDENLSSKVVYSSSDSSVVSVNSQGKIVAKKKGVATITARIASEGISSSIDLIVKEKSVEQLYLSSSNLSLDVNEKYNLKYYFYPSDAVGTLTFASSNSSVVSVNSDGKVEALKEGTAIITAKTNNNVVANCIVEVKNNVINASSIEISVKNSSFNVGESIYISSVLKPENVTNKNITYLSSDSSIAVVDKTGKVTGVRSGNVVITATSASGVSDTISLTVRDAIVPVTRIDVDSVVTIEAGKSSIIKTKIYPSNATNKNIVWQVEDPTIAKVNSSGVVTGVKGGSTVVTATNGNAISSVSVIVSDVKVEKIELNYKQVGLYAGGEIVLKSTVLPSNATNLNVTWVSSDENIAKVSKDGKVTAINKGTATITALSSTPGVVGECIVNVSKIGVESFKVSHDEVVLSVGNTRVLSVSDITPSNATYKDVIYKIEDNAIAKIEDGVVTGLMPGTTTIHVMVDDIVEEINLTVLEGGEKVYFIDTYSTYGGTSDAILLESNGKYALIDTGSTYSSMNTIKFLKDLGVRRLEFILITHFHSENFGGIYGANNNILLSGIKVGKVYMKAYSGSDSYFLDNYGGVLKKSSDISTRRKQRLGMYTDIRDSIINSGATFVNVTAKTKKLNLGEFEIDLYNVEDQLKGYSSKCLQHYNCDENSNSIVSYVSVNGKSLYLASDIYNANHDKNTKYLKNKTEEEIAKNITNSHKEIDIYKASNYGFDLSNVEGALKRIKPKYSVITNSKNYFDKNSASLKRIDKHTTNDIYFAGDGTVVVNIDKTGNINFVQLND